MKDKIDLSNIDPVELKTILGLRPGIAIIIGMIIAILILFFLLFMLPGITSDSSYIRFSLNAHDVAIYEGGRYIGSSEGSVYRINSGKHVFSFEINGVNAGSTEYSVKKHIFFTLIHRNVETIEYTIDNNREIEEKAKDAFASGAAKASRVIDYSSSYHLEPYFSNFAYNAVNLGFSDIKDIWLYSALHITSNEMYDDYLKGLAILDNSDIEYSSDNLATLNDKLKKMYASQSSERISFDSTTEKIVPEENGDFLKYPPLTTSIGRSVMLSYPDTNEAGQYVDVQGFCISRDVVSEYMYALFVEDNPYWSKSNKEILISDGVVDENYLNGILLSTSLKSSKPIRNISYYAAKNYIEWLSNKDGIKYSLPTEVEWIIAAKSAEDKPYAMSLISIDNDLSLPSNMLGQLWEFTDTSYIPLSRLIDYNDADALSSLFDYDDVVIKGGSYINSNDGITIDSVGVVDKSICSEYIGFRVVSHE